MGEAIMLRVIGAVLLAAIVNFIVVFALEIPSAMLFPVPAGVNMDDPVMMKGFVAALPVGAKLMVLFAWAAGVAAGSSVAMLVSRRVRWTAWAAGAISLAGVVWSLIEIPHPLWMMVAGVVIPIAVAAVVSVLLSRRAAAPTS
jgi:hypothetical protein